MRAALYHRTSVADQALGAPTSDGLDRLRRHATTQGWTVVTELYDRLVTHNQVRPKWRELREIVSAGTIELIAVTSLCRLFPSPVLLVQQGWEWVESGVAIVSLEDCLNTTTEPDARVWRRSLQMLERYRVERHGEATRVGAIRAQAAAGGSPIGGRPMAAVDRLELADLYRKGLSYRDMHAEIRRRSGGESYGYTTMVKHLHLMRDDGVLDSAGRLASQATTPLKRGGRPRKSSKPGLLQAPTH